MGMAMRSLCRLIILSCIIGALAILSLTRILSPQTHAWASYNPPEKFPRKIWQIWTVEPMRFADRDMERARTWTSLNPEYRYEVLTDDNAVNFVEANFGSDGLYARPDIVSTYKALTAKILQADLLRYLVMYVEGGVYADIDVEAVRPIEEWIPERHSESQVDLVIGIETDEPDFKDHPILGAKARSLCQWTIMSKPRHPVMLRLIDNIIAWIKDLAKVQNKEVSDLVLDFDQVLSGTGPGAFTQAILEELTDLTGEAVTWDVFHNLRESKLLAGVLVLPAEAFAAGSGHSDSGMMGGRTCLVEHWYHASSWPSKHHRYIHPAFGAVETCNWERECVDLWDANTAFFDALSEDEQLRMIGLTVEQKAKEKLDEGDENEKKGAQRDRKQNDDSRRGH